MKWKKAFNYKNKENFFECFSEEMSSPTGPTYIQNSSYLNSRNTTYQNIINKKPKKKDNIKAVLFFTPQMIKIWNSFPEVLIIDSTNCVIKKSCQMEFFVHYVLIRLEFLK